MEMKTLRGLPRLNLELEQIVAGEAIDPKKPFPTE